MSTVTGQPDLPIAFSLPQTPGPYRAADYLELPEGERVELIRGEYLVSPAPNYLHQAISLSLSQLLHTWITTSGGRGAAAPFDVVLSDTSVVQPDIAYFSKARRDVIKDRAEGAPDLVVEILSPSHAARDRVHKLALYAEHGVPEYWIVDPAERVIEFLLLDGDRYKIEPQTSARYQSPRLPEAAIDLPAFWADVERQVGG